MSVTGVTECELGRLEDRSPDDGPSPEAVAAVEAGARLGVIRASSRQGRTLIRFAHGIGQSYFTSVHLRGGAGPWQGAVDRASSTVLYDALVMFGAASDEATSRAVCTALLHRAATADDDQSLACVTTALEIAAGRRLDLPPETFPDAMAAAWRQASPRRKLAAVQRLEKEDSPLCHEQLLQATRDASYPVRWHAAEALVSIGRPAFMALQGAFEGTVSRAESEPMAGWDAALSHDLAVAGWVLPGLVEHDDATAAAQDLVRRMVALVRRSLPPGHEASIAQGFKLAARIRPQAVVPQQVLDLLQSCGFWYSRLVLVQTLSVVARDLSAEERAPVLQVIGRLGRHDPHAFVRSACAIAGPALRGRDDDRGVWEDEAVMIGTSASTLAVPASVLLADVVILLNLTERGEQREQRKREIYARDDLPYCLSRAPSRTGPLFRDGCHESCPFGCARIPSSARWRWPGTTSARRSASSRSACTRRVSGAARRGGAPAGGSARAARRC